jgi:hypothetical protein
MLQFFNLYGGFFWQLQVSEVTKNFLWKVGCDILHKKVNLVYRKVIQDPFCPFCCSEHETTIHIL